MAGKPKLLYLMGADEGVVTKDMLDKDAFVVYQGWQFIKIYYKSFVGVINFIIWYRYNDLFGKCIIFAIASFQVIMEIWARRWQTSCCPVLLIRRRMAPMSILKVAFQLWIVNGTLIFRVLVALFYECLLFFRAEGTQARWVVARVNPTLWLQVVPSRPTRQSAHLAWHVTTGRLWELCLKWLVTPSAITQFRYEHLFHVSIMFFFGSTVTITVQFSV